jgi:hypothetical protein
MTTKISRRSVSASTRKVSAIFAVLFITTALAFARTPASADKYSMEDQRTLETYALSADNVAKVTVAAKSLQPVEASDPSVAKFLQHVSGETLDQTFKRIDANSKVAAALHSSGLSTKEYWMTSTTATMAYLTTQMLTNGMPQSTLDSMFPWKASATQIAFVKAHQTEIDQWMQIKR